MGWPVTTTAPVIDLVLRELEAYRRSGRPVHLAHAARALHEALAAIRNEAPPELGHARNVFANREHILAVEAWGKGMLGTTLRYDYEVHDEKDVFEGIPIASQPVV
jgi:non-homologous end joining protein Ku